MVQKRAPSLLTGKDKHCVDAARHELILILVRGTVIYNIALPAESQSMVLLFLLLSLRAFVSITHKHVQLPDGRNSKVTDALER